jgi:hypothetical protein
VRVVGDLDVLASPAGDAEVAPTDPVVPRLDVDAACQAVVGAVLAAGIDDAPTTGGPGAAGDTAARPDASSPRRLARALGGRMQRRGR